MEVQTTFKDGDIFRWHWKDRDRSMHCKSGIAVAKDGYLYDTFWGDFHSRERIDLDMVEIHFQGNPADMKEIPEWEKIFYRWQDLVDMNHSNNSRAPVYVKAGAGRCPVVMREYYERRKGDTLRSIKSLQERAAECDIYLARISTGDFDGYFHAMHSYKC